MISAITAASPTMLIELMACANKGTVRVTGASLSDLTAQMPGISDVHYLKIAAASSSAPQPDSVEMEFGVENGLRKYHFVNDWFRRIKVWDIRLTVKSASVSEADRLFAAMMAVLKGEKIKSSPVGVAAILPAASELCGILWFFVSLLIGAPARYYSLSLFLIFYWRAALLVTPTSVGVWLRPRTPFFSLSGLLSWHPSARAQAVWTVVGGIAGLLALFISLSAWLAPNG
ncbi:hypothetical protein ABZ876_01265 [Streptomyces sp. NPDC046931]|uniref:hypothetical protein n=1 Tax=Streptomyces sp. NPDC046931 TaxID=3154806 RepID=UPI0033D5C9A9